MARLEEFRDEILKSCKDKKCQLTEEQQTNLANWRFSIGQNEPMALAKEGGVELRGLAERFQARFPDLMPEKYDNRTYKVQTLIFSYFNHQIFIKGPFLIIDGDSSIFLNINCS